MAHAASSINGDADPRDVWPLAREAAEHAVALNDDLAEAQHALGVVNWQFEWNWPVGERALRQAVALDPSYSLAHLILGHLLSQSGRHAEAEPVMRRARDLDPLNPMSFALSSQVAFQTRDYTAALELAGRSITLGPQFWIGYQ